MLKDEHVWPGNVSNVESKAIDIKSSENVINATVVYEDNNMTLTRTLLLQQNKTYIDIILKVRTYETTSLKLFDVYVFGSKYTSLESYEFENPNTVKIYQSVPYFGLTETKVSLVSMNGILNSTKISRDQAQSSHFVSFSIIPSTNKSLFAMMRVSLPRLTVEIGKFSYYKSADLIQQFRINHVFLNKGRELEYERFVADREHFVLVFENETIAIFRVV